LSLSIAWIAGARALHDGLAAVQLGHPSEVGDAAESLAEIRAAIDSGNGDDQLRLTLRSDI
jgi:hypothetical protein